LKQHEKAKRWRLKFAGMTRADFAKVLACSPRTIQYYESGLTSKGNPISRKDWTIYRYLCAKAWGLEPRTFQWGLRVG